MVPAMSVEIRPATAPDVPSIVELITVVLGEFDLRFGEGSETDDQVRALPGSYASAGGEFWVAVRDGVLLGTAGVFPIGPGTFELRKMYLLPASRGLGLGKQLLDTSLDWIRERGGTRVVLDTVHEMTRAIAFYEAHGFVRDDRYIHGARCSRGYVLDLTSVSAPASERERAHR